MFKLQDLNKYSSRLSYRDISHELSRSALGKIIPSEAERMRKLAIASYLNKL